MRTSGVAIAVLAAVGLSAGITYAQQPGNSRKPPSQTLDQGVDDRASTGQAKKGPADRVVTQVPVNVTARGASVAELDESFDEVLVAMKNADGTITYVEVQGTDRAAEIVHGAPAAAPSTTVTLEEK